MNNVTNGVIRLGLPKGKMETGVLALLSSAGIQVKGGARAYRPTISLAKFEVKILKPQNIVEMLHLGSRDLGFAGADWVAELEANVIELLDTGLDPVKVVAAAPYKLLFDNKLPQRHLVVASEYERLTKQWISSRNLNASFLRAYGATEVFPPEDADCIVDNSATGSTLKANDLKIIDEIMHSSTRLFANPRVLEDAEKRRQIEDFVLLIRSVMEARSRVMVELNATPENVDAIVAVLPAMRESTIAPLHGTSGFAIRAAVPRSQLPALIPLIKKHGGSDIVVTEIAQIVP